MQKDELITLTNEMCKKLLTVIDGGATKVQVANYLIEAAQIVVSVDEVNLNSEDFAKALFFNAYKDIAQNSLLSYEQTNSNIKKLADKQDETLKKYNKDYSDDELISKIDDIQIDINDEVEKANEIIKELTLQVKSLEKKSNIDPLTNIYNRRALNAYVEKICTKDKLHDGYHLLMIDVDDFKNINDSYGHLSGDKVLIFLATMFKRMIREADKVFRYGGEEFIIVFNRISDEDCKILVNRILSTIRKNKLVYKENIIRVTLSIGVTKIYQGDSLESIVTRADKALYKAKNSGKDKMIVEER